MKNSFTILELLLSITLSAVIIVYSLNFTKELFTTNKQTQKLELKKIDLLGTKIFLQKNKNEISKLEYKNKNLYFDNSLLLENIENFTLSKNNDIINININLDNTIMQNWKF